MAISKKVRFEIFKRDSFTCQYCGQAAPDVVLHVDHIEPKSKGGTDGLLNLVTSCVECNQGKRDRRLSDNAVIVKQKAQLDALQERREQLEMLMEWHKSLIDADGYLVSEIAQLWDDLVDGYSLNEHGMRSLKKWLRKYKPDEIINAMRDSVTQYLEYEPDEDGDDWLTKDSVEKALNYIPKICASKRKMQEKPYLKQLYYIRGILRNRCNYYFCDWAALALLEEAVLAGIDADDIEAMTKKISNWTEFKEIISGWIEEVTSEPEQDDVETQDD